MDIVNEFFHKHYPDDHATNWEMRQCAGTYGREYQTRNGSYIFPLMVCADGFEMSVQGHFGAYGHPRDDFADEYTAVEIYMVSAPDPILNAYENQRRSGLGREPTDRAGMDEPMGYVPIEAAVSVIERHGGMMGGPL